MSVTVTPVSGRRDLDAFMKLPYPIPVIEELLLA